MCIKRSGQLKEVYISRKRVYSQIYLKVMEKNHPFPLHCIAIVNGLTRKIANAIQQPWLYNIYQIRSDWIWLSNSYAGSFENIEKSAFFCFSSIKPLKVDFLTKVYAFWISQRALPNRNKVLWIWRLLIFLVHDILLNFMLL